MSPTFGELLQMFLAKCETRGLEPASLKSYRYFADGFLVPCVGEVRVDELTITMLDEVYALMHSLGYNPTTIRKCNATAGGALKMAERMSLVTRNVARLTEMPRSIKVERDIPTPEELATFLKYAARRDRLVHDYARTMAASGVRPGEACALMQEDLIDGCLHVRRAVDVCQGAARIKSTKTGKSRKVTLDPDTIALILARPAPYIFGAESPARTDLMSKRWKRIACRAGVTFTPRSCRHFHATQLLGAGMSPRAVADRLGHSTPVITLSVYAQSIPAHDEIAATTIATVLPKEDE